jgi:hypothetical protein
MKSSFVSRRKPRKVGQEEEGEHTKEEPTAVGQSSDDQGEQLILSEGIAF